MPVSWEAEQAATNSNQMTEGECSLPQGWEGERDPPQPFQSRWPFQSGPLHPHCLSNPPALRQMSSYRRLWELLEFHHCKVHLDAEQ